MDLETIKWLLTNRIAASEENMRIAQQIGNIPEYVRLEWEVEETKLTLSQLW